MAEKTTFIATGDANSLPEDGKITQIQLYPIDMRMGAPRSKMGIPICPTIRCCIIWLSFPLPSALN